MHYCTHIFAHFTKAFKFKRQCTAMGVGIFSDFIVILRYGSRWRQVTASGSFVAICSSTLLLLLHIYCTIFPLFSYMTRTKRTCLIVALLGVTCQSKNASLNVAMLKKRITNFYFKKMHLDAFFFITLLSCLHF